jgi:hypothetical protein
MRGDRRQSSPRRSGSECRVKHQKEVSPSTGPSLRCTNVSCHRKLGAKKKRSLDGSNRGARRPRLLPLKVREGRMMTRVGEVGKGAATFDGTAISRDRSSLLIAFRRRSDTRA